MAGKFNYEKRFKYPHLLGEDKIIWDSFIIKFPDRFDTVDYDIHVGSGIEAPPEEPEKISDHWRQLTMKRIDVVGWKNQQPTIIEVKKRVALDTLGQVLGYRFLYLRDNPDIKSIPLLIVSGSIGPDDKDVLDHYGISFLIV